MPLLNFLPTSQRRKMSCRRRIAKNGSPQCSESITMHFRSAFGPDWIKLPAVQKAFRLFIGCTGKRSAMNNYSLVVHGKDMCWINVIHVCPSVRLSDRTGLSFAPLSLSCAVLVKVSTSLMKVFRNKKSMDRTSKLNVWARMRCVAPFVRFFCWLVGLMQTLFVQHMCVHGRV